MSRISGSQLNTSLFCKYRCVGAHLGFGLLCFAIQNYTELYRWEQTRNERYKNLAAAGKNVQNFKYANFKTKIQSNFSCVCVCVCTPQFVIIHLSIFESNTHWHTLSHTCFNFELLQIDLQF